MNCELCGKKTELYTVLIEGTELKVCEKCSTMGKVLKKPALSPVKKAKTAAIAKKAEPVKELVDTIVEDYAKKIRTARENSGMTQKDFAKKINEKESVVHKLETGTYEPPIALAKKLEKLLHITLVEQREEAKEEKMPTIGKPGDLTIGDIIKL